MVVNQTYMSPSIVYGLIVSTFPVHLNVYEVYMLKNTDKLCHVISC